MKSFLAVSSGKKTENNISEKKIMKMYFIIYMSFCLLILTGIVGRHNECHASQQITNDWISTANQEVSLKETETGCVLENTYLKLTIDKLRGGRITSLVHKKSGKEFTSDVPNGGIMKDVIMETGMKEYWGKCYDLKVVENSIEKVAVKLTGSSDKLPFVQINKIFTLLRNSNVLRVDYKITNLPEAMAPAVLTFRNHNYLKVVGEKNNYFIPTSKGIKDTKEGDSSIRYKDIVRGWAGFIGQKSKVGLVYSVDYKYIDFFYNWFGEETTLEAFYKPIKVESGKSLETTVLLKPFKGLENISASRKGLMLGFTGLKEKYQRNDKIDFFLDVATTQPSTGTVDISYKILPLGKQIPVGKGRFNLQADGTERLAFSFKPTSEGTVALSAKIKEREGTGELLTAVTSIIIGKETVALTIVPEEKKSDMVALYAGLKPQHLSMGYETPHVKWARPLQGGKVSVLALTSGYNGREVVELAQHLDMDFDVALFGGGFTTARYYLNFTDRNSNSWLTELLKKKHDVILMGGIGWAHINKKNRTNIIEKIKEGTGLVYISPFKLEPNTFC